MPGVCSFVQLGQGFGYLLKDVVDRFQILMYAIAALGNTPGTWTAAECWTAGYSVPQHSSLPAQSASGYAAPSQTLVPTFLKWQLLFEDPFTSYIWIARAIPRSWLSTNRTAVTMHDGVTSRGRLSFSLKASGASTITASITMVTTSGRAFAWPTAGGGIKLRLRAPSFPTRKLASVTVGGQAWTAFNATEETVTFDRSVTGLDKIVATFA